MLSCRASQHAHQFVKIFLTLSLTLILLLLMNGAIPVTRAAGPWYVAPPPLGDDANDCATLATPCATIGAAMGKASPGDTINIASGTYTENITVTVPLNFAGAGTNSTIVDGNLAGRVFTILSGTVSIADLTVQHGNTSGDGGGIYADGVLILTNINVLSNTATRSGGGIWAGRAMTITDSLFQNNRSVTQVGGGLRTFHATSITGGVFQGNQAPNGVGGGLEAERVLTLVGTRFTNNTAKEGGGVYLTGSDGLPSSLSNVSLDGNTATSTRGNALFAYAGSVLLYHGTIASPTLGSGSAIYGWGNEWSIYNTLVASYTVGYEQAENPGWLHEYRTLFSGVITPYVGSNIYTDSASFSGSAGFVNPIGGDYHLTADSDAINHGMYAYAAIDLDGNPRPVGCGYDIGAYEYQTAPDCMLTIEVVGTGVVTPTVGIHPYAYGATANLTASTSAPWGFGGWSGDESSPYYSIQIPMDHDKSVTVTFGLAVCYATPDNGLTVESSPNATAVKRAAMLAPDGGTVKLAGTCAGVQPIADIASQTLYLEKPMTLVGGYTSTNWLTSHPVTQPTTLDAQHAGRVIWTGFGAPLTLANLTVQNGYSNYAGGGIDVGGALTLTNVNILSNTAILSGGGIRAGGNTTITGGVFQNNQSLTQNGGGLEAERALTLVGTRFTNNTAQQGGGVYLTGSDGLSSYLTNVILDGNTATSTRGNALFAYAGSVSLYHGTIASSTLGTGSAIHGFVNDWFIYSTLIANYTIGYNQVSGNQGWLYEYRTLFSSVTIPYVGTNIDIDSNSFSSSTGFVDPIGGDYHLTMSSKAINRGLEMMRPITTDFDGNPRPVGCGYDIGAYEYQSAPDCMLTVNVVGTGIVTPTVGVHSYPYGAVVPLTASTSAPWSFAGWSGDINSTSGSAAVYMLSDNSVTATFVAYRVYLPLVLK